MRVDDARDADITYPSRCHAHGSRFHDCMYVQMALERNMNDASLLYHESSPARHVLFFLADDIE